MVLSSLREFFLLRDAKEKARSTPEATRAIVVAYVRAAEARLRFTGNAVEGEAAVVPLTLARDGVKLLVCALVASHAPTKGASHVADLDCARELETLLKNDDAPPPGGQRAVDVLATTDLLYFDGLDDDGRAACANALRATAKWLRSRIDVRSVASVYGTSIGRVAAAAVALAYVVYRLVAMPNLAIGKPVVQSSVWPGAPPSSVLVDGDTTGAHGPGPGADYVHTGKDPSPSVTIDLEGVHTVREVRLYNRNDTNFDDGLPYVLELSEDGKTYDPVAQRDTHFGTTPFDPPWRVHLNGKRARFVRVRCKAYLTLSEVEVFGR